MSQPMSTQEVLQILVPVIDVLDQMGVVYRVGGSVASSYHGQQRATQDVDLIADLHLAQVGAFVAAFDPAKYLVQDQSVTDAILRQRSFNIIELTTMNKIDVFIQKSTAQAQHEQQRAIQVAIAPGARPLWISSAEDMILEKLLWWQLGGGISTRQWADIIGIIQAQAPHLDMSYLQTAATALSLTPLIQRAFADAGIPYP